MSLPKNNYKINDEDLTKTVKESISIAEVFRKLNLCCTGSAYKTLHRRIEDLKIDITHFKGQGYLKDRTHGWSIKRPLKDVLVINSTYVSVPSLKKRLLKENFLENKCYLCPVKEVWNGQPLTLQLDHINGVGTDNRIENLRLLCPNCHSQTPTFAGKNKKYKVGANGGT